VSVGEYEGVVREELEALVKRDLMEVIYAEFERIASIYREINKLCSEVDVVRVHPHVEVHSLRLVMDGLPAVRSIYFIFSGGNVVKVEVWRYDIDIVSTKYGPRHDHEVALIEIIMFGDRCFIMKDVDEDELNYAVNEIVSDLMEGLREGES
jgi:hypothetical protein